MSDMEAKCYYAGLPSSPPLLARTSINLWEKPKGPEAYRQLKQLGVVVNHKLNTIWEDKVAPKVHACLDKMAIRWTSTDVVRLGIVGESPAPIILWIGVAPEPLLDAEDANAAAFGCLDVLKGFNITDVQVELRESFVTRFACPKLLPPALSANPTAAVRHPLTHALGLSISAQAMPFKAGSGGFFMSESSNSDKLLLITARHVLLPQAKKTDIKLEPNDETHIAARREVLSATEKEKNIKFERKNNSQPRYNVLLLGDEAYERCLVSIQAKIGDHMIMIRHWKGVIETVGDEDEDADAERQAAQGKLQVAENAIEALSVFCKTVEKDWAAYTGRVLGHVVFSPPLRLGAGTADEQYTEDYAIIEIDNHKIDRSRFMDNVFDLGTMIPVTEFMEKMYPNAKNTTSFKYPPNRLLRLQGTISEKEMRQPTSLDKSNDPCLIVIKDGSTTGVTIGRASGIFSYVREYFDGHYETSKEWAIQAYDQKSGAFSNKGDSGAVIVNGLGHIGGLLTGGSGLTVSSDITYATPILFLLKSIRANGYCNAHLNPV